MPSDVLFAPGGMLFTSSEVAQAKRAQTHLTKRTHAGLLRADGAYIESGGAAYEQ